jgi:hypothetical protein
MLHLIIAWSLASFIVGPLIGQAIHFGMTGDAV